MAGWSKTRGMTVVERFWYYTEKGKGCWEWIGTKNAKGYGQLSVGDGKYVLAHRFSFALAYGHEPEKHVCHRCDNPGCVKPAHLFSGTDQDNHTDKTLKGHAGKVFAPEDIPVIRQRIAAGEPLHLIAAGYGCSRKAVQRVKNGSTWRWCDAT